MTKNIKNILPLLLLLTFVSCQKDLFELPPTIKGNDDYTVNVIGSVKDENNNPIQNAEVIFQNTKTTTDVFGLYVFNDIKVNSQHNFISIQKNGYYSTARTFRALRDGDLSQHTILLAKDFEHSFISSQGGSVSNDTTLIIFPKHAIVYADNDGNYNGEVLVSMKYLNPTNAYVSEFMPGDLTATNENDDYLVLTSFGMNYVELESPTGRKLQIKDCYKATMSSIVPADLIDEAPSRIDLWYFHEDLGLWMLDGHANLIGNKYVGDVGHFTCWNYDTYDPAVIASGRILDADGNGIFSRVHFFNSFGLGAQGTTDLNGYFNGPVPKDQVLKLQVRFPKSGCSNLILSELDLGPFTQDTDLGNIFINNSSETYLFDIESSFLDCNMKRLDDVIVQVDGYAHLVNDGNFKLNYSTCLSDPITFKAIDLKLITESETMRLSPGKHRISDVGVCNDVTAHITLNCDLLNISETLLNSPKIYGYEMNLSSVLGYNNNEEYVVEFCFFNDDESSYELGSFAMERAEVSINNSKRRRLKLVSGSVIVDNVNEYEGFLRGSYQMDVKDDDNQETFAFYGKFKVNIK